MVHSKLIKNIYKYNYLRTNTIFSRSILTDI